MAPGIGLITTVATTLYNYSPAPAALAMLHSAPLPSPGGESPPDLAGSFGAQRKAQQEAEVDDEGEGEGGGAGEASSQGTAKGQSPAAAADEDDGETSVRSVEGVTAADRQTSGYTLGEGDEDEDDENDDEEGGGVMLVQSESLVWLSHSTSKQQIYLTQETFPLPSGSSLPHRRPKLHARARPVVPGRLRCCRSPDVWLVRSPELLVCHCVRRLVKLTLGCFCWDPVGHPRCTREEATLIVRHGGRPSSDLRSSRLPTYVPQNSSLFLLDSDKGQPVLVSSLYRVSESLSSGSSRSSSRPACFRQHIRPCTRSCSRRSGTAGSS